ncbi:MAG: adenylate/guanylate cyclase domain-containing protein [Sandaracinus sp.]
MTNAAAAAPPPAPDVRVRVPLLAKLALMACVLAVLPLAVVGLLLVDVNAAAVEEMVREQQILALDDLAHTIDVELRAAEDDLGRLGGLFADPSLDDATRLAILEREVEASTAIDHAALYDASGTRIAVIEEHGVAGIEVPETLPAEMRTAIEADHVATGAITATGAGLRALVAVRIRVGDRTTGYVASAVSLAPIQARVTELAHSHFHGGEDAIFVVDRDFALIAHPDAERTLARETLHDGILAQVTPEMLGPTLSQSGEYVGASGTPMVGSTAGIVGRPWALVAQIPQSVAYASLTRMRTIIVGVVIAAILLALGLGLAMAGAISRPLARLTAYARRLADREFDERVEVGTKDELAVLGAALNRAASDLAESEQAIRKEVAIRTDLGRYVPGQLVDRIVRREADMRLGGERRAITVLFADVVGFTPLTERLSPEVTVTILNELFTILTEIVFKHGGTVDKFVGDCVMAFWGAPSDDAEHVLRALEAAEDMQTWLETGNERWKQRYGVTIQLAIGLHTGEAVVGNIGSEKRMEYTAIGGVVNLAARLEAIARPAQILVTDSVRAVVGDRFEMVDADLHRLSGYAEPVHLWEVRP